LGIISSVSYFVFKNEFISKQKEWTDHLKYCPSLPTFSHLSGNFRIPSRKKWLVFGGDPIFDFCERSEPVTCQIVLHPLKQPVIRRSNVRRIYYRGCDKTSHLSISKYFFTTLATWDWALSWRRITLSCFCSYSSRFSRNARLKRINCSRYRSPVMETRFQQLIINKTLLVPSDTEHDLRTINVRPWC